MTACTRPLIVHVTTVHHVQDTRILHRQCTALAEEGYEVRLLAATPAPFVHKGVSVIPLRMWRGRIARLLLGPLNVLRQVYALRPDLVQIHDPELLPIALVIRALGYPVVYDAHEDHVAAMRYRDYIGPVRRRMAAAAVAAVEKIVVPRLSAVIAPTPAIVQIMQRHHAQVVMVQNYPPKEELLTSGQDAPLPHEREDAVVYVGVISPERGILQMLDAVSEVAQTRDCKLLLAGDFSDKSLYDRVQELPQWRHVEYVGRASRSEVARLFARARAGLVILEPNRNYVVSVATKMFEYMSAGLPVIASNFPAWRPIFEAHSCGVQVEPTDSHALAQAIHDVMSNPSAAAAQGLRGQRAVVEVYNWEAQRVALLGLYDRLVGAADPRS